MILFTADIHIKLGQKNVPVDWAVNRYNLFLEQLTKIPHSLHIVGGDIFDKLPSLAELGIFFKFVQQCTEETICYSGNHEATKKNETFFSSLVDVVNALNPKVKVLIGTYTDPHNRFSILPYEDLHKKGAIEALPEHAIFTHVRGEIPPHVKPEVDLEKFARFPIVYAGDLHSHSNSQRNIVYPGSPMTTSFHRNNVETGYLLIDEDDLTKWTWHKFDLPQLIRKTVSSSEEMIPTKYDHTIYEIEGDLQQLSTVEHSELLDKKIVKRSTEVTINLMDKTIPEELDLYLEEVLKLPADTRSAVLEIFNAYHGRN